MSESDYEPKFDCYVCDLIREFHIVGQHEHAEGIVCEECMGNLATDAFFGGAALLLGKMPTPLPLCAHHKHKLSEKIEQLGTTLQAIEARVTKTRGDFS